MQVEVYLSGVVVVVFCTEGVDFPKPSWNLATETSGSSVSTIAERVKGQGVGTRNFYNVVILSRFIYIFLSC